MRYGWNIRNWVDRNIGWYIRKDALVAWIYSLLVPIDILYQKFLEKNEDLDFRTKYNSQQMVLAALLNKVFGVDNISVVTGTDAIPTSYDYFNNEAAPTEYIYFDDEAAADEFDYYEGESPEEDFYTVYVPASLSGEDIRINGWIKYYNSAGKTYKIIYI